MICASGEIGLADLFPTTQPAEIMDITEFGAAPGTPLAEALGLDVAEHGESAYPAYTGLDA